MRWAATLLPLLLAGSATLATSPAPVAGLQDAAAGSPGAPNGRVAAATVDTRPVGTLAGIALAVDGGAALDRPGREGENWLLAHTIAAVVEAAGGGTRIVETEVLHDRWLLRILAEPGDVGPTLRDLRAALDGPLPAATVLELRERLLVALSFERGSPAREMEVEKRALLDGFETPWSRPVRGTPTSVEGLTPADLEPLVTALEPSRLHLAVVGPVDRSEVAAALGLSVADLVETAPPGDLDADPAWDGPMAWQLGERVRVVREVVNSWLVVGFPVPADVPETVLGFLAHRVRETVVTDPPDPGLFDAEVRILRRPEGRILLVEAAVVPEATRDFEARILAAPALAARPVEEGFFHWLRRRFRAAVVLHEAAPERAAARKAEDLLFLHGAPRPLADEAWNLDPDLLLRAARSLGEPRILVWGPAVPGVDPAAERR